MAKVTGSRARPSVPPSRTKHCEKPGGTKKAIRQMAMPTPTTDHGTRGGGRAHGG